MRAHSGGSPALDGTEPGRADEEVCARGRRRVARASERTLRAGALLLGVLALGTGPSAAQYTRSELDQGRLRLGPLRLAPSLTLLNGGHDSNVFHSASDPISDSSIVLRGSLATGLPVRDRLRASARGWLDYSYYRTQTSETSRDPGGDARLELDLGSFTAVAGGGILRARPRSSLDVDARILRNEGFAHVGLEWRILQRVALCGGLEERSYRFDSDRQGGALGRGAASALDRDTVTGRLQARYRLTSLTTLVGSADMVEDEFRRSSHEPKTRSYRYLVGFELGNRALVSGRALVGVRDVPRSSAGTMPSYRGVAALAEVAMPISHRGRLSGSVLREVQPSSSAPRPDSSRDAYLLSGVHGTLEWELPFSLLTRLSAGRDHARYLRAGLPDDAPVLPPDGLAADALPAVLLSDAPRRDRVLSFSGSLLRSFGNSIRAGGSASYSTRTSTFDARSYRQWVYGLQAEIRP